MKLPFRQSKQAEEGENVVDGQKRRRQLIVRGIVQLVVTFMAVVAVGYTVISLLLGSSLFIPSDAKGVLESVEQPKAYSWTSESVRLVKYGSETQRQDGLRSAAIDLDANRFQALTAGTLPERTLFNSDGRYTLRLAEADQNQDNQWKLVTNFCGGQKGIRASALQMPTADELLAAQPELAGDKETVDGRRAWLINFKPTPAVLKRMFWISFFEQATKPDPGQLDWVLSDKEIAAIKRGAVKVDFARAFVTRDKPRSIRQIDMRFKVDGGSSWRLLAKLADSEDRPLKNVDLGEIDCSARRGAGADTETDTQVDSLSP